MTPYEAFALVMGFFAVLGLGLWIAKWEADSWERRHKRKRLPHPQVDDRDSIMQFRRMNRRR